MIFLSYIPYFLLAVTLFTALFFFFHDFRIYSDKATKKIKKIWDIKAIEKRLEEKLIQGFNTSEHNYRVEQIIGKRKNIVRKVKTNISTLIDNNNHSWGYIRYSVATIIGAILGYLVGLFFNNFGVAIVMAWVGASLPYIYLNHQIKEYEIDKNQKLLIVMGNIQSVYMLKDDFVQAVAEVLPTIPDPLYKYFKLYVDEVLYIGTESHVMALERLARLIDNYYFYEYIQLAIQAEAGETGLKYTMESVPQEYQRYLQKNQEYSYIVQDYNIQFLTKVLLFPIIIGFIRLMSKDYYDILVTHPLGKFTLFVLVLVFVFASIIYRKFNGEVKLEL